MLSVGWLGRIGISLAGLALIGCGGSADDGRKNPEPQAAEASQPLSAAPTLTTFSPTKAVQGTVVTINGTGFLSGAGVSFNGTPSSQIVFVNTKRLTAVVPPGGTSGPIKVTVPLGSVQSSASFLVLPKVTGVTPQHAFVGDFVSIAGSGFSGTASVKLGTSSSTFDQISDSILTAAVPAGFVSGKVTVTTPTGSATSTVSLLALPLLTTFSPTSGPVGTSVTITGEGFSRASGVKFGTKAAAFSVQSDTQLTAVVPVTSTGKISVETPNGNRTSSANFTLILAPTVTSFTPLASELPIVLTVNGKNFVSVTAVKVGAVSLPSFTLVSSTKLTVDVPLGTPGGRVSVVNVAGSATSSATFTAIPCSDVDGDSVCDRDDRCPGFDDRVDSDGDTVADGCDVCPSAASAGNGCGAGLACDGVGACSVELACNDASTGAGVLRGSVVIDATDTAGDVARLAGKWCVTGDVTVTTTQFADMAALSGLVEINGGLFIGPAAPGCTYPCDSGNRSLTSLHGLEGLRRIGAAFQLSEHPSDAGIASLAPLNHLKRLGTLDLRSANVLTDFRGLEGVTALDWLFVESAPLMASLAGLENLLTASYVDLQTVPQLADICALSHITSLVTGLNLVGTGLASLHGLEGLTSAGSVQIGWSPQLSDLSALSNLVSVGGISLQGHGITSLLPFSHVTHLEALSLYDTGVSSLDGLNGASAMHLSAVDVLQNPALTSMVALGVAQVDRLTVKQNPSLVDCGTLVVSATARVEIESNDVLTSLSCLQQSTALAELRLIHNPLLQNVDGLAALTQVNGGLTIGNEDQLTSLAGLGQLQTAGYIDISYTALADLHGLESLTTTGSLSLRYDMQLTSLSALSSLTDAGYAIDLESDRQLSQCEIAAFSERVSHVVLYNIDNGPECSP